MGFAFLLGPWLRVPLGRNLLEAGTEVSKFSQVLAFRSPAYPLAGSSTLSEGSLVIKS